MVRAEHETKHHALCLSMNHMPRKRAVLWGCPAEVQPGGAGEHRSRERTLGTAKLHRPCERQKGERESGRLDREVWKNR